MTEIVSRLPLFGQPELGDEQAAVLVSIIIIAPTVGCFVGPAIQGNRFAGALKLGAAKLRRLWPATGTCDVHLRLWLDKCICWRSVRACIARDDDPLPRQLL